jgi:type III pantothenate kinase
MILVIDVGNTHIKIGLYEGDRMAQYWRMATNRSYTSDEYGTKLETMFNHSQTPLNTVHGIIISSVVPTVNYTIEHMCRDFYGITPIFVGPGIKTGLNLRHEDPRLLGADRICNAVAAATIYGAPCITVDFGTATSYNCISGKNAFLGGCISPGMRVASEALVNNTARLPLYELSKPDKVIGRTTVTNLQSGLVYGYVGQVEYLIHRMKEEMGEKDIKVVATGGFSHLIAGETNVIDLIDGRLTLKGLKILYDKNATA